MNAGIVLCGGQSRRFGRDKCTVSLGPRSLIDWVLQAMVPILDPIWIIGRPGQVIEELIPVELQPRVQVARDEYPDRGPWEGLRVGLSRLSSPDSLAFVCGCDFPFISRAAIERLLDSAVGFDAAVPWIEGRWHPLPGVYRAGTAAAMDALAEPGSLSLWRWIERIRTRPVTRDELAAVDPTLRCLINVNDEAALVAARQSIGI
jgi:molybdopterin-guanine dinucleotide biosynthesis protein A